MKKILAITLFLVASLMCSSQNRFGVFVGINQTNLSDKIFEKNDLEYFNSNGFHIGGLYEIELNNYISFRPKLALSQRGIVKNFRSRTEYKIKYVNLPLNFKFFKKTYVLFGPEIGYVISKKRNDESDFDVEPFDYGLNLGVGREFYNFFVELNLYRGFKTPIDYPNLRNMNNTNTVYQFSLGYNFK